MTYEEIKKVCDKAIAENYQEDVLIVKNYQREIKLLKRFYDNGRDIYQEFEDKKDKIDTRYIVPFLLGFTKELTSEKPNYIQVQTGSSGGIDIDTDLEGLRRDEIFQYLKDKYGEDCVFHVGTTSTLGVKSSVKDIARVYGFNLTETNRFSKALDSELSFENNLEIMKANDLQNYQFYLKHKQVLDLVPEFVGKPRNSGKHAGGVIILDKPIYNYVPVEKVSGELVTAFPESGSKTHLDEMGVIKLDLLSISVLDVMSHAVDMINEKIYLIEDDDGLEKAVPESYITDRGISV